MKITRFTKTAALLVGALLMIQAGMAQMRQRIISPEIGSDKMVTFRFYAPQAHKGKNFINQLAHSKLPIHQSCC